MADSDLSSVADEMKDLDKEYDELKVSLRPCVLRSCRSRVVV